MYYKFKAEIELNKKIETQLVNKSIRKVLKEFKVDKFETINDTITFKKTPFGGKIRMTGDYMSVVRKGFLNVNNNETKTKIYLISYISLWPHIFMFLFLCVAGLLSQSILFTLVTLFLIGFSILMTYMTIKNGNFDILRKVKENVENKITDQ